MTKKRIILLSDNTIRKPPGTSRYLGSYMIASALEELDLNLEVIVIDYFTVKDNFFDYIKTFINEDTIIVGISNTFLCPHQSNVNSKGGPLLRSEITEFSFTGYLWFDKSEQMVEWLTELKQIMLDSNPDAKLILGGSKSGFLWKSAETSIHYSLFDYICVGKAEQSIQELAQLILDPTYDICKDVEIKTQDATGIDFLFNSFDRNCPLVKLPKNNAIQHNEALSIEISRGCAFNCKFCYFDKRGSTRKTLDSAKDELMYNYENFGTTLYSLTDDCFNDNPRKVEEICNLFTNLPFDIEWVSYARPDLAIKFPETFDAMVESGCKGVSWGLESFNWQAAKVAGKANNPDNVKEMLLNVYQKHHDKCFFQGTFIAGLPYETKESIYETVDFITNNKILDFVSMGVLILSEFDPSLDQNFMDFADFVKNPMKYNFTKVSFSPYDWEHATMSRTTAIECAKYATGEFHKNGYKTHLSSIWFYPHLRFLGYIFDEIEDMARNPDNQEYWRTILAVKEREFINNYHDSLKRLWS